MWLLQHASNKTIEDANDQLVDTATFSEITGCQETPELMEGDEPQKKERERNVLEHCLFASIAKATEVPELIEFIFFGLQKKKE